MTTTLPFEGASGEGVFQLTPGSVSPTRLVARDALGRPREETICMLAKHEKFVDVKGNICTVPLQCGRTLNRTIQAQQYEQQQRRDQIDAGGLPLEECPHTTAYQQFVGEANGGALVAVPDKLSGPALRDLVACRGRKQPADWPIGRDFMGCEHMEAIIKLRRNAAREEYEAELRRTSMTMTQEQAEAMIAAAAAGGASAANASDARARLSQGKGEPG